MIDKKGKFRPFPDGMSTSDNQINGSQITQLKGTISSLNSSIIPLNSNQTFIGQWEDVTNICSIDVNVKTDQLGICYFDNSSDGINVDRTFTHPLTDSNTFNLFFSIAPRTKYVRIRFVNTSASNQTFLRLQTIYSPTERGGVYIPAGEPLTDNSTVKVVKSLLAGKRDDGVYGNVSLTNDNQLMVTNESYLQAIAEGYVVGHQPHEHFGRTTNVNTTLTDVWNGGGIYVFPTVAQKMNIASTSTNDTLAGTGAQKVYIEGLNASFQTISEVINMNGTVPVTTANSYYRINDFYITQSGTLGVAAGTITIKDLTNTTIYGEILTGLARSRSLIYTVPDGYNLFIDNVTVGSGVGGTTIKTAFATFTLKANSDGTNILNTFIAWLEIPTQNSSITQPLNMPLKFPTHTDIKMSVIADYAGGITANCAFRGWLDPVI